MFKRAIISFFKPSLPIAIIMGIFLGISVPAQFQRWGPEDEMMGIPKPPFYDELQPYPFRLIYAYFMIPAAFVGVWTWYLSEYGILVELPHTMLAPLGAILHVIYFYILACIIGLFWRNIRQNGVWAERAQIKSH